MISVFQSATFEWSYLSVDARAVVQAWVLGVSCGFSGRFGVKYGAGDLLEIGG